MAKHRATRRYSRTWGWLAGTLATALVVTLAVVADGFDSRDTPREDHSLWVERSAGQYARVNTETAEIDTVRKAENSSGIVQHGELRLLFTQGYSRAWPINAAAPADVHDAPTETGSEENQQAAPEDDAGFAEGEQLENLPPAEENSATSQTPTAADPGNSIRTPNGTRQVVTAGGFVIFLTQSGESYISHAVPADFGLPGSLSAPKKIDPYLSQLQGDAAEPGEEDVAGYQAAAVAVNEDGLVVLYSREEQRVRWYDAVTNRWRGEVDAVSETFTAEQPQLAIIENRWVLFDAGSGELWQQGSRTAAELDIVGEAKLQKSSSRAREAFIADEAGLWQLKRNGDVERIVQAKGRAVAPQFVDGTPIAAWVGSGGATMWTPEHGKVELEIDPEIEDLTSVDPEIRSNGSRALIIERHSGMMWTLPEGTLIPASQWNVVDPPKQEAGTLVAQDVTEQEPPVARADVFGVRAGEPTVLPLLLNDFDPNRKDVLTIVPESLDDGLAPAFGTVSPLSDSQAVLIQPAPSASGQANFSYRVSDGVNLSDTATVTVTVVDSATNTAPQWCPVEGCQRSWPSPELAPGGTLIAPILEGWVDPEGDPMMLAGVELGESDGSLRALVTADGKLAVRHLDPNAPASDAVLNVRVVDSKGESTERELRVRVRPHAAIQFAAAATMVRIGETNLLRPLERVTGGSGSFQLLDATVHLGELTVVANQSNGTIEATATVPGESLVTVTVRDNVTAQETTGVIRVTSVALRPGLTVPPLRAFVRPLADSTVEILAAIPGANTRALSVHSATVRSGQLRADIIEHSRVRVSGSTPDGQPGRIGAIDVTVAEGELSGTGRLTVFQVAESVGAAIAVTDTTTVRAGAVVDIPVLDNDVAPPGERLVLHPEVGASGAEGELAFASGGKLRYLAPSAPGSYTLSYITYGVSSPEQSDIGQVRVTVLPQGSNRDPQPATVTVRVAPGEKVTAAVPLSGVDPDGDRVRLVSVGRPEQPQLVASIQPRSSMLQVEASQEAQRGVSVVNYTVRDSRGGEAEGKLRIIVTDPDPGSGAPVVYSDYVRIARSAGEPATVRPLDNDLDPSGGALELIEVEPNVPEGSTSPRYRELVRRLDLSQLAQGVVTVQGGELGTVSFKYTVQSKKSRSTAQGLIVVQVSESVGQQAPMVADTVLSVRDRADFERSGVDVITGRVRWSGGDDSALSLSLWGSTAGNYSVQGSTIRGKYRAEGDLIPFKVSGTDASGAVVESFGFLIVPPLDELRLTLKTSVRPVRVDENKSVDIRVDEMLDLGAGDRIELAQEHFGVQRSQASCEAINATTVRYTAGKEAPWNDSCVVRVRLTEQRSYTIVPIPISIVPREPAVQLTPLTRTIAPGESEMISLLDMVQWEGNREGRAADLRWQVVGGGNFFTVNASGTRVMATAKADALPGTEEVFRVSVRGAGGASSVLALRVGEAAIDAPRGGTVSLKCTVGSDCTALLIGAQGEYDPFVGKVGGGLKLVDIDDGGCVYGNFTAIGNSVRVNWPAANGPGGRCTASFTVRDAQNRVGTGLIELDALGVPRAPTSVTALSADHSSISVTVTLSGEQAHPEVTGVELLADGAPVGSCALGAGQAICTVTGLTPGERRTYFARAVNAVGASEVSASGQETWAYVPPDPPTLQIHTLVWPQNNDPSVGRVRAVIGPSPAASHVLKVGDTELPLTSNSIYVVPAGIQTFSVAAVDDSSLVPPGYVMGANGSGGVRVVSGVQVVGAPTAGGVSLELFGQQLTDWNVSVDGGWNANGGDALKFELDFYGGTYLSGTGEWSGSGLPEHQSFTATVRASNSYGYTGDVVSPTRSSGTQLPQLTGSYQLHAISGQLELRYKPLPPQLDQLLSGELYLSEATIANPIGSVYQCAPGGINCSDPGPVTPVTLGPASFTLAACVSGIDGMPPSADEVRAALNVQDSSGVPFNLVVTGTTAEIHWPGGDRPTGAIYGAVCTQASSGAVV